MLPLTIALARRLPWVDWLTPQADGLYHTPPSRGWGVLTIYGLAGRIVFNAIAGAAGVSVLACFEENQVARVAAAAPGGTSGAARAVVLVSIIWAM